MLGLLGWILIIAVWLSVPISNLVNTHQRIEENSHEPDDR